MPIGPSHLDHLLGPWAMVRRRRTILLELGYLLLDQLSHAVVGAIMGFPQGHHLSARTAHRGSASFSSMLHVSVGTVSWVFVRAKADNIAIEIVSRTGLRVDVCKVRFEIAIRTGLKIDVCKVVFEVAIGGRVKTPKIGIGIIILWGSWTPFLPPRESGRCARVS